MENKDRMNENRVPVITQDDVTCIVMKLGEKKIEDVLNNEFMQKYTNFFSFRELKFSSMVWIDWNMGDVVYTRTSLLDRLIAGSSQFATWEEMYKQAEKEYAEKRK